jgi:hypothetical protein
MCGIAFGVKVLVTLLLNKTLMLCILKTLPPCWNQLLVSPAVRIIHVLAQTEMHNSCEATAGGGFVSFAMQEPCQAEDRWHALPFQKKPGLHTQFPVPGSPCQPELVGQQP